MKGKLVHRPPILVPPHRARRRCRRQAQAEEAHIRGKRRDAERKLCEILADLDMGTVGAGRMTTAEIARDWLAAKKHAVEPLTFTR